MLPLIVIAQMALSRVRMRGRFGSDAEIVEMELISNCPTFQLQQYHSHRR